MSLDLALRINFPLGPDVSFRGEAEVGRAAEYAASVESDPEQKWPRTAHSITSSAVASSAGGTLRPSAFAVFRLMFISNFVGVCTGRSAGLSPRRMRST